MELSEANSSSGFTEERARDLSEPVGAREEMGGTKDGIQPIGTKPRGAGLRDGEVSGE